MQKGIIINTRNIEENIRAEDMAGVYYSFQGASGILDVGRRLSVSVINDNLVRMMDGYFTLGGHVLKVLGQEDFVIESGTLGMYRTDLIIAEYIRDGVELGHDILHFRVLRGAPVPTNQVFKPVLTNTDTIKQAEVAAIRLDGARIVDVTMPSLAVPSNHTLASQMHDTGWINLSLVSPVTVFSGQIPQYRKIGKTVYLRGAVASGLAANRTIATLPENYRPSMIHNFTTPANGTNISRWAVWVDGQIVLRYTWSGTSQTYGGGFAAINTSFLID